MVFAARSGAQVVSQSGNQFINQLSPTSSSSASSTSPVASLLTGSLQGNSIPSVDILYIDASVVTKTGPAVLVGEELNAGSGNGQLSDADYDQITFNGATNVVAALPVIQGTTDYAFAITGVSANNLCFYSFNSQSNAILNQTEPYSGYSYDSSYVPAPDSGSGCTTLPPAAKPPNFTAIAALTLNFNSSPQLLVEDSANNLLYVVGVTVSTGATASLTVESTIPIAPLDGPGPIFAGDLNGDGNTDFILNGQSSHSATVYLSNGSGGFAAPVKYFSGQVYSMLLQNMGGSGHFYPNVNPILDMVVEGGNGGIEIFKNNGNGTFQTTSEGGTGAGGSSLTGDGGHLVAIDSNTLNILTATPIGLSVLTAPVGTLNYALKGIYNIGPGRSSYALADLRGNGFPNDLAVNSPEGVAIALGDGNGGYLTSLAYSALAPVLSTTVNLFRNGLSNPHSCLDVVAAIDSASSAVQGQLLTGNVSNGNCDETFTTAANPTNIVGNPSGVPSNLWSNILSGDFNNFNADNNLDLAYSLTGLPPLPTTGTGLYVQFGNGNGTFQNPVAVSGASSGNTLYGESAVGYFESSDNLANIANADANDDDTLLSQASGGFNVGLNAPSSNPGYNQVAAGYFKLATVQLGHNQDLVFQQGTSLVPFKNTGDGTGTNFTQEPALTGTPAAGTHLAVSTLLLTDIDGDGNGDVVAIYHNSDSTPANPSATTPNWLYIWWGNGDGTFSQTPFILQLSRNYYLAAVGDMNGDGYPDLVLSDGYVVGILYNQGKLSSQNGRFVSDIQPLNGSCPLCGGEQQFLAGQGINSLSLVKLGGAITPSLIVANGGATISDPLVLAALGQTSLPANPPDVNTGGITVLANRVITAPVTGSLSSKPSPSNIGATFTMTATFSSIAGVAEPTGPVQFFFNGAQVAGCSSVALTQGATYSTATCVVPVGVTTVGGTFPIGAAYSGDSSNSPLTVANTQPVEADQTTTTLDLCVGPTASCRSTGIIAPPPPYVPTLSMIYGQTFNGITQVNAVNPSTLIGTTVLNDVYNGVLPPRLLCTLSPLSTTPCPPSVGTGTQVGVNVFTSSYVPGTNDIINGPSTSPPVTITVTPDTVNATVVGTPSSAPVGQPVTLTATLAGVHAPLGTAASPVGNYVPPPGPVVFMDGTTPIACSAPAALVAGASGVSSTATCTTSSLPVGTDPITVTYAGSLDFQPTASAAFNETIAPLAAPSFTLTVTPNPVVVTVGYGTLLNVTVTAQNGFSEGVNLACGAVPSETTCTFTQPTIAGGGGQSNLILETTAPHNCGATQPYFFGANGGGPNLAPLALPALAGLFALFIPGRRRWLRALLAVAVVAGIAQIAGCGTCTDLGTRPNTYTIQVIGTSTVTGEVQSQAVTLNATI